MNSTEGLCGSGSVPNKGGIGPGCQLDLHLGELVPYIQVACQDHFDKGGIGPGCQLDLHLGELVSELFDYRWQMVED